MTALTFAGRDPPALTLVAMPHEDVARLDPRARAVIDAQALLANPCILALCALVLVVLWKGVCARSKWAFRALALALPSLQVFAFASDAKLGSPSVAANLVSTTLVTLGLGLCALGLRQSSAPPTPPPPAPQGTSPGMLLSSGA